MQQALETGLVADPLPRRRFTVTEYHEMIEAGILTKQDRVELLHGEIIEMSPINPKHAGVVDRINKFLHRRLDDSILVRVQSPIQLNEDTEPEPDLSLLKFRSDFYTISHPVPADVLLVIEVAESSTTRDRIIKMPAYANARIPEFWIIDLQQDMIEVYADPSETGYRTIRQIHRGETITPQRIPELSVLAEDFLG